MNVKMMFGSGAIAAMVLLASPITAQPVPSIARDACLQRTAEEMVVATRDISVVSAGPVDAENGVRTLFMRNNKTGRTAECRVNTIDGTVLSVSLTGGTSTTPPNATPTEGSFEGRGTASGSVFGRGRQANATLSFNRGNFSLGVFVPPGTSEDVNYQGTVSQLRSKGANGFTLDGRIRSFASSANDRRVVNTGGTCRIEVFDARIISVSCNANVRGGNTRFTGMKQF